MIEQYLRVILTFSIIIAFIALAIIVFYVVKYIRSRANAAKVLQSGRKSKNFIYNLIATSFPRNNIFRNVLIPVPKSEGGNSYVSTDLILVNHGGIAVIKECREIGRIDNPVKGDWIKTDSPVGESFPNPFEQNMAAMRAIEQIVKREKLYNIPIRNIVVFSQANKNVQFKNKYEQLLLPGRVITAMRNMNQNRFLSYFEVRRTADAIRKYVKQRRSGPRPQHTSQM